MTHLFREIHEQPAVLRELLESEWGTIERLAGEIVKRDIRYILIAARGSSDNAAFYGSYLFGTLCRIPVALATPSVFTIYGKPPRLRDALVLGVSQSGQSPDIVTVLEEGRRQGALTACITNCTDSPLAGASDYVICCRAGREKSIAATKTYTAQLMALAMLASRIAGRLSHLEELKGIPDAVAGVLAHFDGIASCAQRYRYMNVCAIIGRGYNYATAYEIALKLKELSHIIAEPYSSADFMHGPFAIVEEGFPVMVISPRGKVHRELLQFIGRLRESRAELIVISDDAKALSRAHTAMQIPSGVPEWLTPIVAVVPGQIFAYSLTVAKGYDPDRPRSLHKVTKTV